MPDTLSKMGRLTVLVVDDWEEVRDLVPRLLVAITANTRNDLEVKFADDGAPALQMLNDPATHVDLVISDNQMPSMHGLKLLRLIRTSERLRHLPFILMSGDPSIADEAERAGADAFLCKCFEKPLLDICNIGPKRRDLLAFDKDGKGPITADVLHRTIRRAFERSASPAAPETPAARPPRPVDPSVVARLRSLFRRDP